MAPQISPAPPPGLRRRSLSGPPRPCATRLGRRSQRRSAGRGKRLPLFRHCSHPGGGGGRPLPSLRFAPKRAAHPGSSCGASGESALWSFSLSPLFFFFLFLEQDEVAEHVVASCSPPPGRTATFLTLGGHPSCAGRTPGAGGLSFPRERGPAPASRSPPQNGCKHFTPDGSVGHTDTRTHTHTHPPSKAWTRRSCSRS